MKKNSIHDYAKALYEVTSLTKASEQKKVIAAFASLLYQNNIVKRAPAIIAAFERYAQKQEGGITMNITTARKIDKTTLDTIKKTFGAKVEATNDVDESLIGGLIVRTEDTIFDASLKTQLQALSAHLI